MRPVRSAVIKIALVTLMLWCLWLPLADVLRYPQRISVFPNLVTDAATYYELARDLSATWHNNIPTTYPPLWVGLMATVFSVVGPSYVAGKLISWTGLIVCVVLAAWLARRMYGSAAAWTAAVLCAASAGLRAYVGTLQYEVTTAMFLLAGVALAVRAAESVTSRQGAWRAALAGLSGALLILTRETFVIAVVMLTVWIAHRAWHVTTRRSALARAGLYLAVALSLPLAWAIVQSTREGRFVAVTDKGPTVIALGNHPTANGTYNEPLVGMAQPAGIPFIRQYPRRTAVLFVRKALYFWGVLRDGWAAPEPLNAWIWRATTGALPLGFIGAVVRGGWLLLALVISLWLLRRRGLTRWWVLPGIVIAIWAVHVISLSSYRFGVPTLPLTYVIVSGPVAAMLGRMGKALRSPVIAIAACVSLGIAVAAQYQNWPLQVTYDAVDLDGLLASNELDAVAGRPVRVADAKRGVRPVVLLADEYLPAGRLTATIRARRVHDAPDVPGLQVVVYHLDGTPACLSEVPARDLPRDRFADFDVSCHLRSDGPATLAVVTLGAADIAIDRVNLSWHQ
jgi:4-amino-4-deoxy-L-arabinose transferase-like glycosyltransferase